MKEVAIFHQEDRRGRNTGLRIYWPACAGSDEWREKRIKHRGSRQLTARSRQLEEQEWREGFNTENTEVKSTEGTDRSDEWREREIAIEVLRFFCFGRVLQGFDPGAQTLFAKASLRIGRHGNRRQLRAPAAAFRLAGHCGAALCASGFHIAMMAQLCCAVQSRAGAAATALPCQWSEADVIVASLREAGYLR